MTQTQPHGTATKKSPAMKNSGKDMGITFLVHLVRPSHTLFNLSDELLKKKEKDKLQVSSSVNVQEWLEQSRLNDNVDADNFEEGKLALNRINWD